ncbi:MAG: hypothetical protein ACKOEC_03980, partial [Acidimicrobiia bacterium]
GNPPFPRHRGRFSRAADEPFRFGSMVGGSDRFLAAAINDLPPVVAALLNVDDRRLQISRQADTAGAPYNFAAIHVRAFVYLLET